jgi:hypothetical protein
MKFLGYPENSAGYKTYDPLTHKVEITRAPIFREEARAASDTTFEEKASNSDSDGESELADETSQSEAPAVADNPTHVPNPEAPLKQTARERCAPRQFDPTIYGAHGR